ncbi:cupredoxin domain-containing protein, partial [Actinomadura sp.]|uniref:cupredoxin domain-containing protein n=1 Tax=Actinomadura sp. TaxID=1989 RepID=UPI0037C8B010
MIVHRLRAPRYAAAHAVVLAWLVLTALAVVARDRLPAPQWLLIHVFLLGAVTNAVVAWTDQFAIAVLRLPAPPRWWPAVRLAALNAGVAAVLRGATDGHPELATAGAVLVVGVVCAHVAVLVVRSRRARPGRFGHVVPWYACSGLALIAGGTLGGWMASGHAPAMWHMRLEAAHIHANLLGWVGLAVLGTLFTLWPAVLRTPATEHTPAIARLSLRLAAPGLAVAVAGLAADARWAALAGLLLYTAGTAVSLVPFARALRRRRPRSPAAWLLAAGTGWFLVALAADLSIVATRPPAEVAQGIEPLMPFILAGFVGQTLLGVFTHLLPAPPARGWTIHVGMINVAVPLLALPVPGWLSRTGWILLLVALAAFVSLAGAALVRSLGVRVSPAIAGTAAGCLLTAAAVVFAASGQTASPVQTVAASGTRVVEVSLVNMRISPETIEAAPGTRLVLRVTNKDAMQHDLRLESGQATPMLGKGESATLTVPSVTGTIDGWCTVPGHRAAGMTMQIKTTASEGHAAHAPTTAPYAAPSAAPSTMGHEAMGTGQLDMAADPSPGWKPFDAALKPAPGGREHRLELRATDRV